MKEYRRNVVLFAVSTVLAFTGRSWSDVRTERTKLIASDAQSPDFFGWSVSIDGDRIVVGAYQIFNGNGAAYVYRLDDNGTPFQPVDDFWIEEAKLTASDGKPMDLFGISVSLSGDRALIGADRTDEACPENQNCESGSAYVFRRDDNGTPSDPVDDFWVEEAKLTAPEPTKQDLFGADVSLSGDLALIGSVRDDDACVDDPDCNSGAAYVFRRHDNGTSTDPTDDLWVEEAKLTASDAEIDDGFAESLAISSGWAVVGVPGNDDACPQDRLCNSGSVYVFRRSDNGTPSNPSDDFWVEEAKLTVPNAAPLDFLGTAVSIDGDRLVASAEGDDDACSGDPNCNSGAAYVFRRSGNTWVQEAKLTASDAAAGDTFGLPVVIAGDRLIAAAFRNDDACPDDPECESGSAYLFQLDDNDTPSDPTDDLWVEEAKLTASDAAKTNVFGLSLALGPNRGVVGAPLANSLPTAEVGGAAYVFVVKPIGPSIPAASTWGVGVMVLLVLIAGTMLLRHRRAFPGKHAKLDPEGGNRLTRVCMRRKGGRAPPTSGG